MIPDGGTGAVADHRGKCWKTRVSLLRNGPAADRPFALVECYCDLCIAVVKAASRNCHFLVRKRVIDSSPQTQTRWAFRALHNLDYRAGRLVGNRAHTYFDGLAACSWQANA
jgi:hypothetical protein